MMGLHYLPNAFLWLLQLLGRWQDFKDILLRLICGNNHRVFVVLKKILDECLVATFAEYKYDAIIQ